MAGRVPSTMRAAVVRAFGGPEVVRVAKDVPVPRLAPDEVLVRVAAASVSPLDARVRAGYARALYAPMLPLILGRDVSGEVVARGDSARSFPLGAQVFGALSPLAPRGAHAEFVAVREAHLAPKPRAWTHAQAAAVPFAALTAWRALFADADLRPGERLLVHGLGSTVGGLAAQLAYARGAAAVAGSVGARSRARVGKTSRTSQTPICGRTTIRTTRLPTRLPTRTRTFPCVPWLPRPRTTRGPRSMSRWTWWETREARSAWRVCCGAGAGGSSPRTATWPAWWASAGRRAAPRSRRPSSLGRRCCFESTRTCRICGVSCGRTPRRCAASASTPRRGN